MRVKIQEIRKSLGLTQDELSKRVGLSRPYMAQLENGTRTLSTKQQMRIATALGVDPTELVDFAAPEQSDEDLIIRAFRSMSPEQRQALLVWARAAVVEKPKDPEGAE